MPSKITTFYTRLMKKRGTKCLFEEILVIKEKETKYSFEAIPM